MWPERPTVGRDQDVALIQSCAERAAHRRPQFVYIEGFMGVGKSSLVRKALEPYANWRELPVVLDRCQRTNSMALLRTLVSSPGENLEDLSVEETTHLAIKRAAALGSPTIISIMNTHWADDESAAAILRICTLLRDAPLLIIMSARPSPRSAVSRLAGFARNSPDATYIRLDPFGLAETKTQLEQYLNIPVSNDLVAAVHQQTAGYPLLTREVGVTLASAPIGTRRLNCAVSAVRMGQSATRMRRALDELLQPVAQETIRILGLLAASAQALSQRQLEQALGGSIEFSGMLETGLVVWDDTRLGFHIRNPLIARALLDRMSTRELAEVHTSLCGVVDGPRALHHRAEAARVHPEGQDREALVDELRDAAVQALIQGDREKAFEWFCRITQLRPDAQALKDMMHIGVQLGQFHLLRGLEDAINTLDQGLVRQAGLALIEADRNNLVGAVQALESQTRIDFDENGAMVFALAVAHVTARLGLSGVAGRGTGVKLQTLMMLSASEEDLRHRIEEGGHSQRNMSALQRDRANAAGLRSFIELWQLLDHRDPRVMVRTVENISAEIHRLEQVPDSEMFQTGLLAGRGARLRQLSDPVGAYSDLSRVTSPATPRPFLTHAHTQLARVLFGAGFWEESMDSSSAAAGKALLDGEDPAALVAYATWALVPVSQGRYKDVEPLVKELTAVRKDSGPAVCAALDYLHAWKAVTEDDHQTALEHLLRMRDDLGGWWDFGVDPMLLLVRAAHYAGRGFMIPPVHQAVLSGDFPAREGCKVPVNAYLEALQAWRAHDPVKAIERFLLISGWFERQPPLRSGQHADGGHRLHKAFIFLDMGALVLAFPEELRRHRATVVEGLEWAATFFRSVGSQALMRLVIEAISALRPRLANMSSYPLSPSLSPVPSHGSAGFYDSSPEAEPSAEATGDPLAGLSGRERQVAVLIAMGNTNKEIAEELTISVRTVGFHVGNILTKLNFSSRREVRQQLRGTESLRSARPAHS